MTDLAAHKVVTPREIAASDHSEGMSYLESLPRRLVTLYLPLVLFLIILLFPFYWMTLTAIKPNEQLLDFQTVNPFWTTSPTFQHIKKLLFESNYPVEKVSVSYGVLWNALKKIAAGYSPSEKAKLFHDTAVTAYRLA